MIATPEQKQFVKQMLLEILRDIGEIAKTAGPMGAPLGPMYAGMMGSLSLDNFNALIKILTDSTVYVVRNHCLVYVEKSPVGTGSAQ